MSIFLNLSTNNILVEYDYYDAADPDVISTDTAPFYLMEDGHNNQRYIMNSDGTESSTGNTRDRSAVNIDDKNISYGLLTNNKLGLPLNDADSKLTDSANLPLLFSNPEGIYYDTVKIHFIQGFTFNDAYDGVSLNIKAKDKNSILVNLLSGIFSFQDNWITLNGRPFLYGGRQYSSYIEFKVPALRYLKDSFKVDYQQGGNDDILAYKITNGVGFYDTTNIDVQAGLFSTFTKSSNQIYTSLYNSEVTSIASSDEFNEVGVFINESTNGDYIEFYGTYNSSIFGDYMDRLNNSGSTYIAIHDLIVTEQLPNTVDDYTLIGYYRLSTNSPDLSNNVFLSNFQDGAYWISSETGFSSELGLNLDKGDLLVYDTTLPGAIKVRLVASDGSEFDDISEFVQTADISYVQDSEYGEPNTFRPVLKYGGSALSYRLDYTLQILNVNTNAMTEMKGSYLSFDPSKYGEELVKINIADNFNIFDVYNKKTVNVIDSSSAFSDNSNNNITDSSLYSKNVTSFKETINIAVSTNTVIINDNNEIVDKAASNTQKVSGQGLGRLYVTPFDTYIQFNIFDITENEAIGFDLSKVGLIYLNFSTGSGEIIKIAQTSNESVKRESGQVLFKITNTVYTQIASSVDNNFYISTKVGNNSAETLLYSGKFYDTTQQVNDTVNNTISTLNEQIKKLEESAADQSLVIAQQQTTIKTLNSDAETFDEKIEKEIAKRVKTEIQVKEQTFGQTATNKAINKNASKVKGSTFNNFGPTSR